ncbi:MAG: hypothetical protein QM675_04415 [Protaetiibacter sp.]
MHDETDDTIPHAARKRLVPTIVDEVEAAFGDTIARDSTRRAARPATPELPRVPAALRPHHRIRVGADAPIELDRPVHIGRRPRAGRVPAPGSPRLVAVASPEGGISSTHLELREQGSVVVATDMRTLNGSEVRLPGSPVQSLRGGDSIVVTPGTRIDLGEGVVVEVLGPERLLPRRGRYS